IPSCPNYQRYQRERRPAAAPSPPRRAKPASQATNTTAATIHNQCTTKPAPPNARASSSTNRMTSTVPTSFHLMLGVPIYLEAIRRREKVTLRNRQITDHPESHNRSLPTGWWGNIHDRSTFPV